VYSDSKSLEARRKKAQDLISRQVYQKCFGDALKDVLSSSARSLTTKSVKPLGKVPTDGFGFAVQTENITGLSAPLLTEFYGWLRGNVAVTLSALGLTTNLTVEVIDAAIQKTNAALDAAAK
jgi:hypothetical protein